MGILSGDFSRRQEAGTLLEPLPAGAVCAAGNGMSGGGPAGQYPLEQQAGKKPQRCVIQPDQTVDMIAGMRIVPRAALFAGQQHARRVFRRKNTDGVDQAAEPDGHIFNKGTDRLQENGHAIDEKHKYRSVSHTGFLASAERLQSGKEDFQAPSEDAAA